ncbi:MAG: 50S ribosomal protein L15 [Planctomycetota bacterium]|jgi:large subunit ribosomal protein L15
MKLDEILASAGAYKARRRKGRGIGSSRGKTCGRGHKGYHARAGSNRQLGFEGGQTPALLAAPKRGFNNARFRKGYQIVNVASLERFSSGSRVDAAALAEAGLIDDADKAVKILGNGQLTKKLTVVADKFSSPAVEKVTKAGGSVQEA